MFLQGNWVSALHKLASAVGRQLQNARGSGPASDGAAPSSATAAHQPQQLLEPEIAAREARLRQVLVQGTQAARAAANRVQPLPASGQDAAPLVADGGAPMAQQRAPAEGHHYDLQELPPAATGISIAQRQLQLGDAHEALGCVPPLAAGPPQSALDGDSAGANSLPQAWGVGVTMPHMRPRPGPSRLAHQSSMQQAWSGVLDAEGAAIYMADHLKGAAEAAMAEAAAGMSEPRLGPAAPLGGPLLQLQQLHLAMLVQQLPPADAATQSAQAAAAVQQPRAAHLDEPVISLRDARREARSRSATPSASIPRAGTTAAGAAPVAPAPARMGGGGIGGGPGGGGPAAMEVDAGGAAPARGGQPHEADEDEDDPIAAQLAAVGVAGGGCCGGAGAGDLDLGPGLDEMDLAAHGLAGAASAAEGGPPGVACAGPGQQAAQPLYLLGTQAGFSQHALP